MSIGTPEMYGAVADGVTDDFLAIKHAFVSHSVVHFDAKTYAVRGYLGVPSYRTIVGSGKDRTVIKLMDKSPYGYSDSCWVINNTVKNNQIYWEGGAYQGPIDDLGTVYFHEDGYTNDLNVLDQSPNSPLYQSPQNTPWGGLGYEPSSGVKGLRKNILIKDLTVDCNFNNQARHSSYNHPDNTNFTNNSYIPELSWSVRTTTNGINLVGEDITIQNVNVVNYGYGVPYLNTVGTIDWETNIPKKLEQISIKLVGSNTNFTFSSSYNNETNYNFEAGNSSLIGNKIINCGVSNPGFIDFLNYASNAKGMVCVNSTIINDTQKSNYPREGEINGCYVNPGYNIQYFTASFWDSFYLDEFENPELTGAYDTFFEYLRGTGKNDGQNNMIAISKGPIRVIKKISGSWYPFGSQDGLQKHNLIAYEGNRIFNSSARNVNKAVYSDSFKINSQIENNNFLDVYKGIHFYITSSLQTSSIHNIITKNNYVKLGEHIRSKFNVTPSFCFSVENGCEKQSWIEKNIGKTSRVDNLIVEDNIFEIPISSSTGVYVGGGGGATYQPQFEFYKYPFFNGLKLQSEYSESFYKFYRNVSIKNNKFINFKSPKSYFSDTESTNYSPSIFIKTKYTSSMDTTLGGPYPYTRDYFKNNELKKYNIEGNTFNSPVFPSTASLAPITLVVNPDNDISHFYPLSQVNKMSDGYVYGNLKVDGTITANAKSFLIDHPTKPNKKLQYGSLESPYHGVRLTGQSKANKNGVKVELPDYISALVKSENVNVQLTPIGCSKLFYVSDIDLDNNCFYVVCDGSDEECEFYWDFTAIRKDVSDLQVEF